MAVSSKTVELPSGARLTVTIDADLFDLSVDDRKLVFDVVAAAKRFIEAAEGQMRARSVCDPAGAADDGGAVDGPDGDDGGDGGFDVDGRVPPA